MITNERYSHTIDDILDKRITVYSDEFKMKDWRNERFTINLAGSFKQSFKKMTDKMLNMMNEAKNAEKFIDEPNKLIQLIERSVIVQDEEWTSVLQPFFARIVSTHIGNKYISSLITPLCYGHNFQFVKQAHFV